MRPEHRCDGRVPVLVRRVGSWEQGLCPRCEVWIRLFHPSGRLRPHARDIATCLLQRPRDTGNATGDV